jgi:epoxide hydrolase-like predicted phosphatase
MSSVTIEAVIFDFGGVFTRTDVSQALLDEWDGILGREAGTLRSEVHSGDAWEAVSTGRISPEQYWAVTGARHQALLPADFEKLRVGVFLIEPIDEEMVALAKRLRKRTRLALCSNAVHDLRRILGERPDIDALFEQVVVSVEVGLRKPDPAILILTAQRLGLRPDACLFVDDKERNTNAAAAIGMPAVVYSSVNQLTTELLGRGLLS